MKRCLIAAVFTCVVLGIGGPARGNEPCPDNAVLTLEQALDMALKNNSAIKEAMQRVEAAAEQRKAAGADLLPKLSASYSYTNLKDQPYAVVGGSRLPMSSDEIYKWNVAAVQPLFTGFALSTRYEMARYGVDLTRTSRDLARMDVAYRVRDAYYTSLLARRYREVADEAVENLRSHVKDAETFYDQGIIPYNDLLKSKVALAAAMQNRERALANEESAVSSLNMLLGLSLDTRTRLADILEEGSGPELSLDTLSAEALESRPELKAMRTALINADNAVRLARSVYYPTVSLVGAYERVGDNPKADDNDYGNDHNASVGIEARWQFFEWGKTRAEVNRAIFEKYALEEQKRGLEDAVRLDVKNAFLDVGVARANIATAREALDQARENYRITNLQYQQQVTTSTEVLDARTALSQAETSYYGSLYGYLRAIARLDRALGRMPAASAQQARQD